MTKSLMLFSALAFSAVSVPAPAAAPQLTVIAGGLNNPRHLAFAPNGRLYVAEAGLGAGDGNGGFGQGVGFTGAIVEISGVATETPSWRRITTGLVSIGGTENGFPEVVGPDGLSMQGAGSIYVTLPESTAGVSEETPNLPAAAADQLGRLIKVSPAGQWKVVADVGGFNYEWTTANQNAPWAPAGQFPDANPYGILATPGRQFVADAGANTVCEVRADGSIRLIAYVPNPLFPPPGGGPAVIPISDSVPTSVTMGPDGYLYVATLAFGANFARFAPGSPPLWATLPPQSKIYRVDPNASNQTLTDAAVWAAGLNPVTGITFANGAVYVTEYATQASGFISGDVVRIAMNPDGSAGTRTTMGTGALVAPNGSTVGPDGAVYVSNFSISAGGGEVVRVNW